MYFNHLFWKQNGSQGMYHGFSDNVGYWSKLWSGKIQNEFWYWSLEHDEVP